MLKKYNKYKLQYIIEKFRYQLGGNTLKIPQLHILLDGTSSVGKSTLARLLENVGFKYISIDDFGWSIIKDCQKKYFSTIDRNTYHNNDELTKFMDLCSREYMYNTSFDYNYVVYEDIGQHILHFYKDTNKKIIVVLLYASLSQLIDNINRRIDTDPRHKFIFRNFCTKYEVCNEENNNKCIGTVNFNKFVDKLDNDLKYLFESRDEIVNFATDLFKKLEITNIEDRDYKIKPRSGVYFDILIDVTNKSKTDIFSELYKYIQKIE